MGKGVLKVKFFTGQYFFLNSFNISDSLFVQWFTFEVICLLGIFLVQIFTHLNYRFNHSVYNILPMGKPKGLICTCLLVHHQIRSLTWKGGLCLECSLAVCISIESLYIQLIILVYLSLIYPGMLIIQAGSGTAKDIGIFNSLFRKANAGVTPIYRSTLEL